MQTNRSYTKQQLINSMKVVYRLLEYELKHNYSSRKYLNDLTNNKFPEYDHLFQEQYVDDMKSGEDYIGKKNIYDHFALKAIDEYRYNNDKLILYRNFLLLLLFMRGLYLPTIKTDTIKIKSTILNIIDYKTPIELFKKIFTVGESAEEQYRIEERERKRKEKEEKEKKEREEREKRGEKEEKQEINNEEQKRNTDKTNYNQDIDSVFIDTIGKMFEEFADDIDFNFETALNRTVKTSQNDTAEKMNITQFLNSFDKLLTRDNETIIKLFFEVYESKYRHLMLPSTLVDFMRNYAFKDFATIPTDLKYKKLYISGVGFNNFLSTIFRNIGGRVNDYFNDKNLELASDDSNEILKQISVIQDRLRSEQTSINTVIKNDPLLESTNLKYDVAVSIIPEKLDLFSEREAIKKYPFHPINQISFYAYYEKIIHCIEYKSLIIVPISLISSNSFSEKKFSLDIDLLNNGQEIVRDPLIIESAQYQEFLQYYQINKIIKQQNIKKIMLLPKDLFYHTSHQCVLIELTKETCHGVQFIDATIFNYFEEKHARKVVINLHKSDLKYIYDRYGETVFINPDGDITDKTAENSSLISVYVPYANLMTSNILLPWYHIKNNSIHINSQSIKIDDLFEVIKIQKPHFDLSGTIYDKTMRQGTIDFKQYSKSDFSPYGITSSNDISKTIKISTPIKYHQYYGFNKFNLVFNNDILIYVHYKDITDMTFAQIDPMRLSHEYRDNLCFGTNNLIAIRVKENLAKQDAYAKALFLWLMSNEGQKSLQSITKTTSSNRPLLGVDDLKTLEININDSDILKSENLYKEVISEINKINKNVKKLRELLS